MLSMLKNAISIESPSQLPDTQGAVFELFATLLESVHYRCRFLSGRTSGGQMLAIPCRRQKQLPQQLILGHVDTVWPLGTLETMPVQSREGCLYGPGSYDMKAGLVQAVFAVRTLHELGLEPPLTPIFFLNSDEEIGSQESALQIERLARVVNRTFVVEPSLGPAGNLKTQRKGVGRFQITVQGQAAHAGLDPEKGISAIHELSHVIQKLFAMNNAQSGTSVNVGVINGGMRPNVIAPEARAEIDVRVATQQEARRIEAAIHGIKPTVDGTLLDVQGRIERPPLEATPGNQKLWHHARLAADELGLEIDQAAAGGGSDGNWTSQHCPTLDGLGAVGDGAHAVHEHVVENKLPERSALLAMLLMTPPLTQT
ncbi:MAG: carboxypeptidase [Planctomycetaceae bacterium TMED240]|nr:carboxypeptidase [Rhodopirellula sp.]OUX06383.1 MAG: carboxypeptidase [Planctomycetaceae bacterium TMED240]